MSRATSLPPQSNRGQPSQKWKNMVASIIKGITLLVSYISNNTFPQPLPEEEEHLFLKRLKNGDEKARHVLIEHNLRLVAHITKKFETSGEEIDDLISIGTLGLIKAINTFDQEKGTKLATYAARSIENGTPFSQCCKLCSFVYS